MKRNIQPFYVINWDFNSDKLEHYDIMPYLVDCYKKVKKSKSLETPVTFEQFKEFILSESRYMFWSRCEYEVIVYDWPKGKNEYKLDIYEQIEMNIDVITNHFMSQVL